MTATNLCSYQRRIRQYRCILFYNHVSNAVELDSRITYS